MTNSFMVVSVLDKTHCSVRSIKLMEIAQNWKDKFIQTYELLCKHMSSQVLLQSIQSAFNVCQIVLVGWIAFDKQP